jgi:hypothetical protein
VFVMADRLAQLIDLVLYGPIFYAILGGSCHGLDYISKNVLD